MTWIFFALPTLVSMVLLGGWLDLMFLEVFSNLWFYESMILHYVNLNNLFYFFLLVMKKKKQETK